MHYTPLEKNDIVLVCPHDYWIDKQIFLLEHFEPIIITDPLFYNNSSHNRAEAFSLKKQTRVEFWCIEVKDSQLFVRRGVTGPRAVLDDEVKTALIGGAVKMIGFIDYSDGPRNENAAEVCRVIGYGREAILSSYKLL